jgi:P-type Ca2+ transporter type 2C
MTPTLPPSLEGLTAEEAARRVARDGPNELGAAARRTLLASAFGIVREPMSLLLVGCGGIYLTLGDLQESLMLLGFVVFIMVLTLFQERRTERALGALRDMASPRALVVRDGRRVRIAGRDVALGDLVVLAEGDRVPADVTVLSRAHLAVDESLLTGESVSVRKSAWDGVLAVARPGGEDLPFAFAGTLVVQGSALARVHATGDRAEMGRIGRALRTPEEQETALQRETRRLVVRLAWIGGALSVLVAVAYAVLRDRVLEGVLAGLTLAMAILPNEFPVVVAMFLALGAWRLSKRRVLTRRVPAIESIGAVTVLCVDKTGTLTRNEMTVREMSAEGARFEVHRLAREALPEAFHEIVEFSILASRPDPYDPMERAFKAFGEAYLAGTEHLHGDWTLLKEYPLSRELLAVTQVWRAPGRGSLVVAMKGAHEAVADLCHLDGAARETLDARVTALTSLGQRVLAVACGAVPDDPLPSRAHDLDFRLVGLVGLADPVRENVPAAIAECHAAGIRVVMITGDDPTTAQRIGTEIGLGGVDAPVSGPALAAMDDDELRRVARTATVFARVLPEQKLRIVQALRAGGDVVAMTGDGVNDAPALRAADIGVAMGGRGTDVAREAATLVLLDDDFASLVAAVRSGRRIMDNLRKALAYILAVHLPIVGLTVLPVLLGWPLVLLPIHIAFLHLIIDPACSIVFEAESEEADVMTRPPRDPRAPLFGGRAIGPSLVQGGVATVVVVLVYALALRRGEGELVARTLAFATFMVANIGLIFTNRSWHGMAIEGPSGRAPVNRALWAVALGALAFLALVVYVPALAELFRFAPLAADEVGIAVAAGAASVGWFEIYKAAQRRRARQPAIALHTR